MECDKCGTQGENFSEVISSEGILNLCNECLRDEQELPLVKSKKEKEPVTREIVRAKIALDKSTRKISALEKQNRALREIANRNFKSKVVKTKAQRPYDLLDNFHWNIMVARRQRKVSQEQFAQSIKESPEAIMNVERGILPDNYVGLIKKIEFSLRIKLFKDEFRERYYEGPSELSFDPMTLKDLTIADLKKMREQKLAESQPEEGEGAEEKKEKKGFFKRLFGRDKKEEKEESEEAESEKKEE